MGRRIIIDNKIEILQKGSEHVLEVSVARDFRLTGNDGKNLNVLEFTSSDPDVVTVNSEGRLVGVASRNSKNYSNRKRHTT